MSIFQGFPGKVASIEDFTQDKVAEYDKLERPAGYADIIAGKEIMGSESQLKLVNVMLGRGVLVRFPADVDALNLEDNGKVYVMYAGTDIAAVAVPHEKKYVYFQKPLNRKYVFPRVVYGMKGAIIAIIMGYILTILAKHQQSLTMQVVFEGVAGFLLVSSIVYSLYHFFTSAQAHQKMRLYLKKLL